MARRKDHTPGQLRQLVLDAARHIVVSEGPAALTTRGIAGAIGYSPGTLYNLFDDLEDIVRQLNSGTLDALYVDLKDAPHDGEAEAALQALAARYIAFVAGNPQLWAMLFRVDPQRKAPDGAYAARLDGLFGLVENILAPLFPPDTDRDRQRDAVRILWSGLHGMCALASDSIMMDWDDVRCLSRALVATFVAGLRRGDWPA